MSLRNPAIPVQEGWNAPTLVNGWSDFGSPYNPTGYWKDSFGVVHLRGCLKGGTIGSVIFTLPTGYRPLNTEGLVVIRMASTGVEGGRIDISNAGSVLCQITVAASGTSVTYLFLDGLTFRAF